MRVAFIALHFAEYSAHLAAALAECHDVLLILSSENAKNELGDRLADEFSRPRLKISMITPPRGVLGILPNMLALVRAVVEFKPDVIHLQEALRDELILSLPKFKRYPLLMTIHDPVSHTGRDSKAIRFSRHRIYRALARGSVDRVFAHGQSLVDSIEQLLPRLRGCVHSVPHGPLGPCGEIALPSFPKRTNFLFFGRIHEYKGLRYFVQAVQRLYREGVLVCGVIAGRGSDLAANLGLIEETPDAFEVIDRYITEEEVRHLFSDTTAVVLPYIDGTQSGVAAMALGYGRPIIATRVGAIPELVQDGVNGILIAPHNVDELVAAMHLLLDDRALWHSLTEGAARLRSGELSWRRIAAATELAYRAALQSSVR